MAKRGSNAPPPGPSVLEKAKELDNTSSKPEPAAAPTPTPTPAPAPAPAQAQAPTPTPAPAVTITTQPAEKPTATTAQAPANEAKLAPRQRPKLSEQKQQSIADLFAPVARSADELIADQKAAASSQQRAKILAEAVEKAKEHAAIKLGQTFLQIYRT